MGHSVPICDALDVLAIGQGSVQAVVHNNSILLDYSFFECYVFEINDQLSTIITAAASLMRYLFFARRLVHYPI